MSNEVITETKIAALAKFLQCDESDIEAPSYEDGDFDMGNQSYKVLTDEEADEAAAEYILESIWAFRPEFLRSHMGLPYEAEEMLAVFAEKKCESANDTFRAMLEDEDDFVQAAISGCGRGHFLSNYDGEENFARPYYIFRTN